MIAWRTTCQDGVVLKSLAVIDTELTEEEVKSVENVLYLYYSYTVGLRNSTLVGPSNLGFFILFFLRMLWSKFVSTTLVFGPKMVQNMVFSWPAHFVKHASWIIDIIPYTYANVLVVLVTLIPQSIDSISWSNWQIGGNDIIIIQWQIRNVVSDESVWAEAIIKQFSIRVGSKISSMICL